MITPAAYVTPTSGSQAAGLDELARIAADQAKGAAAEITAAGLQDFPERPRRTVRRGLIHQMIRGIR